MIVGRSAARLSLWWPDEPADRVFHTQVPLGPCIHEDSMQQAHGVPDCGWSDTFADTSVAPFPDMLAADRRKRQIDKRFPEKRLDPNRFLLAAFLGRCDLMEISDQHITQRRRFHECCRRFLSVIDIAVRLSQPPIPGFNGVIEMIE